MGSYPKTILASLQKMRENGVMTDVTLRLPDDTTIACHKLILIAASPFFESMFQSGLKESLEQEVQLNFSDADTIEMLVEFIYSDEIDITEDNVETLVDASELLMLKDLKITCEDFMINMLRSSNCSQLCCFGRKYDLRNLIASAIEFIALHFEDIVELSDFDNLAEEEVIEVISDDRLKAKNEGFVFESVVRWVNADLEARKDAFSTIAPLIRFPLCTHKIICQIVSNPLMWNPEYMKLIAEAQYSQFHSGEDPVRNLRTTHRYNGEQLVRLYNGRNSTICVDYTESIEREAVKWNHFSIGLSSEINNAMLSPEGIFWICKKGVMFSLDLKTRKIATHFWKEPEAESSLILFNGEIVSFSIIFKRYKCSTAVVEIFEMTEKEWKTEKKYLRENKPPLLPYGMHLSNKMYVFALKSVTSTEVFDPVSRSWKECKAMPGPCTSGQVVAVEGKIFVIGGKENVCFSYDPAIDAWTVLSPPTTASANCNATAWKGRILLYDTKTNTGEVYDPGFDCWSVKKGLFDEDTKGYGTKLLCSMSF